LKILVEVKFAIINESGKRISTIDVDLREGIVIIYLVLIVLSEKY
jgi:hypothetical protein